MLAKILLRPATDPGWPSVGCPRRRPASRRRRRASRDTCRPLWRPSWRRRRRADGPAWSRRGGRARDDRTIATASLQTAGRLTSPGDRQQACRIQTRGGTILRCINESRYFSRDTYRDIILNNHNFYLFFVMTFIYADVKFSYASDCEISVETN